MVEWPQSKPILRKRTFQRLPAPQKLEKTWTFGFSTRWHSSESAPDYILTPGCPGCLIATNHFEVRICQCFIHLQGLDVDTAGSDGLNRFSTKKTKIHLKHSKSVGFSSAHNKPSRKNTNTKSRAHRFWQGPWWGAPSFTTGRGRVILAKDVCFLLFSCQFPQGTLASHRAILSMVRNQPNTFSLSPDCYCRIQLFRSCGRALQRRCYHVLFSFPRPRERWGVHISAFQVLGSGHSFPTSLTQSSLKPFWKQILSAPQFAIYNRTGPPGSKTYWSSLMIFTWKAEVLQCAVEKIVMCRAHKFIFYITMRHDEAFQSQGLPLVTQLEPHVCDACSIYVRDHRVEMFNGESTVPQRRQGQQGQQQRTSNTSTAPSSHSSPQAKEFRFS